MLHEDDMAYHFWVLMFPVVWGSLSDNKDNQIFLAKPIITLLSQEFHHQQAHKRPNVIPVSLEVTPLSPLAPEQSGSQKLYSTLPMRGLERPHL